MKRILTLLLALAMVFTLVACSNNKPNDTNSDGLKDPNELPPETSQPAEDKGPKSIPEYLNQKYGGKWTVTEDNPDAYTNENGLWVVAMTTERAIAEFHLNAAHFTEKYADGGYQYVKYTEIHDYYKKLVPESSGEYYLMAEFDVVLPSAVDPKKSHADNLKANPETLVPIITIFVEKDLTEDEKQELALAFADDGYRCTLQVYNISDVNDQNALDEAMMNMGTMTPVFVSRLNFPNG